MALITRISRLFRADFNAVLDRLEEPDVLLKQSIREMEEVIHIEIHQLKLLNSEYLQIESKINELQDNIVRVDTEIDICFESNEVELARNQVKRKLEMQRYEKHLKSKFDSIAKKISELHVQVNENKTRLLVIQQKLELLISEEPQVNEDEYFPNLNMVINEDDIEVAFLKEKQARSTT